MSRGDRHKKRGWGEGALYFSNLHGPFQLLALGQANHGAGPIEPSVTAVLDREWRSHGKVSEDSQGKMIPRLAFEGPMEFAR